MAVNIKDVPKNVKIASSILIIIGFVDLFVKIYFRIGGLVDANDFIPYLLSLFLSVGEIVSGYLIFYQMKLGYIAGWIYALLEVYVGVMSLLDYFDIGEVVMDSMYLSNLFVGLLVVYALSRHEVFSYCFKRLIRFNRNEIPVSFETYQNR